MFFHDAQCIYFGFLFLEKGRPNIFMHFSQKLLINAGSESARFHVLTPKIYLLFYVPL